MMGRRVRDLGGEEEGPIIKICLQKKNGRGVKAKLQHKYVLCSRNFSPLLFTNRESCNAKTTHTETHTITGRRGKNNKPVRILLAELMGIKYLGG